MQYSSLYCYNISSYKWFEFSEKYWKKFNKMSCAWSSDEMMIIAWNCKKSISK